ncbi:hypothetical protein Tco_1308828, partial [Tanacetum coccineum]
LWKCLKEEEARLTTEFNNFPSEGSVQDVSNDEENKAEENKADGEVIKKQAGNVQTNIRVILKYSQCDGNPSRANIKSSFAVGLSPYEPEMEIEIPRSTGSFATLILKRSSLKSLGVQDEAIQGRLLNSFQDKRKFEVKSWLENSRSVDSLISSNNDLEDEIKGVEEEKEEEEDDNTLKFSPQ